MHPPLLLSDGARDALLVALMMTVRQEALLEYLEERGHRTGGIVQIRGKYQGVRRLQTYVVRGEVLFKHLSDMAQLPRFKKKKGEIKHKWTMGERYRALVELRDIGAIHLCHDGTHYRIRTQRGLSGDWGPYPKIF